jgi:hypothetical protein
MPDHSTQLVQKLWNYCNILRDDGLSYGDYVEQLTFLLFLKMADEQPKIHMRACGQGSQTVIAALPDISRFSRKAVGLHVDQIHSHPLKSGVYGESARSGIRCGFVSIYFQILLITGALV